MNTSTAQKKILQMEVALRQLKRVVFGKTDLDADTKIWKKYGKDLKAARRRVFRQRYGKG